MGNSVDPTKLLQMIRQGYNPQQLVMQVLQGEVSKSPMGQNLLSLAQNRDTQSLERIARNICAERGLDFNQEFNSFKSALGIK